MKEIENYNFFIKCLIDDAVQRAYELEQFICDIQDHFTDEQIKSFLRKYYQNPDVRTRNLKWSFKFDDYCGEPYIKVVFDNCYDDDDNDHILLKYLIDESELNKYLEEKNKADKIRKELEAKRYEDIERQELARLKAKYE